MHGVAIVSLAVLASACGSKPTPKSPPAELEIAGPASFAGAWVADDDMDFGYVLEVGVGGAFRIAMDRGKLGRCEQKGTLVSGDDPRSYKIAYEKNTCDPDYAGGTIDIAIASFTRDALVVVTTFAGTSLRRTYTRLPAR
ncbi:MAG: hypothetical protein ACKV2T_09805 [Kofleriaceae bacterium]